MDKAGLWPGRRDRSPGGNKISYNTGMNWRRILLLAIFILALGIVIASILLTPEVESFGPESVEGGLPGDSTFWITFSRPMQSESVRERISILPRIEGTFEWEDKTLIFTPDEPWAPGTEVRVSLGSGASSNLGLTTRGELNWSFNISPVVVAYLWPSDGDSEIFTLDPETGETIQVTDAGNITAFTIGPDSRMFYFFADNSQGGSDLYAFNRYARLEDPPGTPTRLISCQRAVCSSPTVSPDGLKIAYTRNDSEIWLFDLESGSDPEQVSPEEHEAWGPLWSPNGRLSYYNFTAGNYMVLDLDSGEMTAWPNQSGENAVWVPGGSALIAPDAFTTETDILRGPTGEIANEEVDESELEPVRVVSSRLMIYRVGDGQVRTLTDDPLTEDFSPAFSPNGVTLAFTRRYLDEVRWTPGRQIWLMTLSAGGTYPSQLRPLTNSPDFLYTGLTWHPDGTRLAAVRFNVTVLTEPPEIWLLDLRGESVRLVIGGFSPRWIP